MKTLQRLSGAVVLAFVLGVAAFGDDPPIEPPPNCGHMETGKCTPTAPTQMQTMGTDVASSITEAARIVLESALPLL